MTNREKALAALDAQHISYRLVEHPAVYTIEEMQALGWPEEQMRCVCKNLFLRNSQKTRFYLLMMPGEKKFKTKDLSHQLGIARLSFAEEEFMVRYLGVHPGSATVMGLIHDPEHKVSLVIDREVAEEPFIVCHPCANTSSIKVKTEDVLGKLLPYTGHAPAFVEL